MTDIVSVPRTDILHTQFLTQAEAVVLEVKTNKDFQKGFAFVRMMKAMEKTLDDGTGLALNGMAEIWEPAEHDGETFEQAVVRETELDKYTIQRHLKVQRTAHLIPDDYREEVLGMGLNAKARVAELIEGGYEMEKNDWLKIVQAPSLKDVERVAREIKGVEPRSNWLAISIDNNGVLMVHTVRGHFECGRLNVWDDNPDVQKAISRLTSCTGVRPSTEY